MASISISPDEMAEIYFNRSGLRAPGIIRQILIQYKNDQMTRKYWNHVMARVLDKIDDMNQRSAA